MTKEKALEILTLLSAMESWTFAQKERFPDYLHERLADAMEMLTKIVLGPAD